MDPGYEAKVSDIAFRLSRDPEAVRVHDAELAKILAELQAGLRAKKDTALQHWQAGTQVYLDLADRPIYVADLRLGAKLMEREGAASGGPRYPWAACDSMTRASRAWQEWEDEVARREKAAKLLAQKQRRADLRNAKELEAAREMEAAAEKKRAKKAKKEAKASKKEEEREAKRQAAYEEVKEERKQATAAEKKKRRNAVKRERRGMTMQDG